MNNNEIKTFLTLKLGNLDHPDIIFKLSERLVIETFEQHFPDFPNLPDSSIITVIYHRFGNTNLREEVQEKMERFKDSLWRKVIREYE